MNLNGSITFFSKISFIDKLIFTKHISVMLKSGIPLSSAIDIISSQSTNPKFKRMLEDLSHEVLNGQSLFKALSKYPKVFDPLYLNLVKIGEESGNLEANLEYLSGQLKKNYEFSKKVKSALIYPEIVISAAIIVGGGISLFVLPKLIDLFKSFDVELPLSTKILLFIANLMKDYGVVIFAGLAALFILFKWAISTRNLKPSWDHFLLSLPVIGIFLQNVELASFCRSLGIMLKSGLPIVTALTAQIDTTSNSVYKDLLTKINAATQTGQSIEAGIVSTHSKFIPLILARMVGVGEKTGKLDESLLYLADFFEDEVDSATKNFSAALEPALLLFIGAIVAFVALAVISPIYQLTGSIK